MTTITKELMAKAMVQKKPFIYTATQVIKHADPLVDLASQQGQNTVEGVALMMSAGAEMMKGTHVAMGIAIGAVVGVGLYSTVKKFTKKEEA